MLHHTSLQLHRFYTNYTIHLYCYAGATPATPYISCYAGATPATPYISIATQVLHHTSLLLRGCYTIHLYCYAGATPATSYISTATRVLHQLHHTSLLLHGYYTIPATPYISIAMHTVKQSTSPLDYYQENKKKKEKKPTSPTLIFCQTTIINLQNNVVTLQAFIQPSQYRKTWEGLGMRLVILNL